MAEHDIKGNILQINTVESEEQERIVVRNIATYDTAKGLSGLDLIYHQYMVDYVDGAVVSGGSTFRADTLADF